MQSKGYFNADHKRYAHWWTRIDEPDDDYPSSKGNYTLLCYAEMMDPAHLRPETKMRCPKCVKKRKEEQHG